MRGLSGKLLANVAQEPWKGVCSRSVARCLEQEQRSYLLGYRGTVLSAISKTEAMI
jgi:hypothetical protein